jgi:hypothetical protein
MNRRKFLTSLLGGFATVTVVPMVAVATEVSPVKPTEWYQNGKYHRVDEPAVIRPDGTAARVTSVGWP